MRIENHERRALLEEGPHPELSAHVFSSRMRRGLFLWTLLEEVLTVLLVAAMVARPSGVAIFHGPPGMSVLAAWGCLGVTLFIIYGGLILNNAELGPWDRALWLVALLLVGPIAAPAYWELYVRTVPYSRWTAHPHLRSVHKHDHIHMSR